MLEMSVATKELVYEKEYVGGLTDPCVDFEDNIGFSNKDALNHITVEEYNSLSQDINELIYG